MMVPSLSLLFGEDAFITSADWLKNIRPNSVKLGGPASNKKKKTQTTRTNNTHKQQTNSQIHKKKPKKIKQKGVGDRGREAQLDEQGIVGKQNHEKPISGMPFVTISAAAAATDGDGGGGGALIHACICGER